MRYADLIPGGSMRCYFRPACFQVLAWRLLAFMCNTQAFPSSKK